MLATAGQFPFRGGQFFGFQQKGIRQSPNLLWRLPLAVRLHPLGHRLGFRLLAVASHVHWTRTLQTLQDALRWNPACISFKGLNPIPMESRAGLPEPQCHALHGLI